MPGIDAPGTITFCSNNKYEKIGTAKYGRDHNNISRVYILYKNTLKNTC